MKISHQGHSCVLIEKEGTRILIDPGTFAFDVNGKKPSDFIDINAVLLTHEHRDHTEPEIIKEILSVNPDCSIYTNDSIAKILGDHQIKAAVVAVNESFSVGAINIKAIDCPHEKLPIPVPQSIGFLLDDQVLHPSDCLHPVLESNPKILLAPASAPWATANDVLDFVERIKPEVVMPIHDAVYRSPGLVQRLFVDVLRERGYTVETDTITT